jgi:hypothetical protein
LYITPKDLREALTETASKHPKSHPPEIIGFDACFMSMFEMALELEGTAKYMVASQDEVPDASFPYDNLIKLFRMNGKRQLPDLLKEGLHAYVSAYEDCICNADTGMNEVTLSVLDLEKCNRLKNAIRSLACALLETENDASFADVLIKARSASQDYATGLYVDLKQFCANLSGKIGEVERWRKIKDACQDVVAALTKGKSQLLLDNTEEKRGGGISIYLPYLKTEQYAKVSRPLAKGGRITNGGKGFTEMLNGGATEYLMCARRTMILDTESYYGDLRLAGTHWYDFIAKRWTKALIQRVPADLDYHYSAQQSWINATRPPARIARCD